MFSSTNYYRIRFLERAKVIARLAKYEGPWQRIRGGEEEYFLKLYYSYAFAEERYENKREVSFTSDEEARQYLKSEVPNPLTLVVNANEPGEILNSEKESWTIYFVTLWCVLFIFCLRMFSFLEKKNYNAY
ncbi:hypothetical protein [Ekhidna sp.]|uniref:hypothetical protein n=1 Tax=Ekhidna sp. TaxID=2608089 RepID=UPI003B5A9161